MKKILISFFFLVGVAFAQTGQCHNSPYGACTADSSCTGTGNYCHVIKHTIFIVKENRSFDELFGRFPGVTGGPRGTAAVPYNCNGTSGGCSGGHAPAIAGNPASIDGDCNHSHSSAINNWNSGNMNGFNGPCTADWNYSFGLACSDWATSGQLCATNSDCTSGSCNQNTIATYWTYAGTYGLADHMFASLMGPSYPSHLYIFTASSQETSENPEMLAGPSGSTANGQLSQTWSCDSWHYGQCSNSKTTLCTTNTDCSGGGTCNINLSTGFGYYNTSTSCTKNPDLGFSLTNVVGNGTTATANCATNCGALPTGVYVQITGNSVAGFNPGVNGFLVTSVTGSPVTSFTFASSTNSTGTGGTATYDYCVNGNVYSAATNQNPNYSIDQLGNAATFYVAGVCTSNISVACTCAALSTYGGSPAANPCTDTSGACSGGTCNPTKNIGASRGAACPNVTTIADKLDAASISWKFYNESNGELWNPVAYVAHLRYGSDWTNNVNTATGQFITDAAGCTSDSSCSSLASVIWIDSGYTYSEHPTEGTMSVGMAWDAARVNAVMTNTYLWRHSNIFIFWDDWGGHYDHISPSLDSIHFTNGIRVPLLCVGAYCNNGVNTTVFTFASMLKHVEVNWGLSALNVTDSAANDVGTSAGGMLNLSLSNAPLSSTGPVGASQINKGTRLNLNTEIY